MNIYVIFDFFVATSWMMRPNPIPGCPVGLEYLTQLDAINVKQIPSLLEGFKNDKWKII